MDKELRKGLLYLGAAVAVVAALFVLFSDPANSKAVCIAQALKDGVPYANIDHKCKLTPRPY